MLSKTFLNLPFLFTLSSLFYLEKTQKLLLYVTVKCGRPTQFSFEELQSATLQSAERNVTNMMKYLVYEVDLRGTIPCTIVDCRTDKTTRRPPQTSNINTYSRREQFQTTRRRQPLYFSLQTKNMDVVMRFLLSRCSKATCFKSYDVVIAFYYFQTQPN